MKQINLIRKHIFAILDVMKFALLLVLAITFINFNVRLGQQVNAIHDLSAQQKSTAQSIQDNTTVQLNKLNNHINCIVYLFTQPNRTALRISDVNSCQITPSN